MPPVEEAALPSGGPTPNTASPTRPSSTKAKADEACGDTRSYAVIALIAEGLSNNEIASRLHIATHTVKSHVRNIVEKPMLHTR